MEILNILKVIDIDSRQLTEQFRKWLYLHADRAYTDNILKEHLYDCELIEEISQFVVVPTAHREALQQLSDLCRSNEAGYFRIISN